jgi:hypothetical protein
MRGRKGPSACPQNRTTRLPLSAQALARRMAMRSLPPAAKSCSGTAIVRAVIEV